MLRSNRKNSPIGTNGIKSSTLPSYYNGYGNGSLDTNNINNKGGSSSNGHSLLFQRRRRGNGNADGSNKGCGCCCSKWSTILLLILFSSLGSYLMVHDRNSSEHAGVVHHFHKAIQTIGRAKIKTHKIHDRRMKILNNKKRPQEEDQSIHQRRRRRRVGAAAAGAALNSIPILPPKPPRKEDGLYDTVILGAGPAGLTAALFAARAGLSVLVLGSDAGSLSETSQLENFPSWQFFDNNQEDEEQHQQSQQQQGEGEEEGGGGGVGGTLWLQTTKIQAAQWGATFALGGLLVDNLQQQQQHFVLEINNGSYQIHSRSVIVATGATGKRLREQLGPIEDELWGKSIHSCAVCDGSNYHNKIVVVVGGGDAAIDGAILLSRYAAQVIVVHRRLEFRATNSHNIELLKSISNIRLEIPFEVTKLETTSTTTTKNQHHHQQQQHVFLTGVVLKHSTDSTITKHIECDGMFELIGSTPNTDWLKGSGAQLDEGGFITLSSSNPSSSSSGGGEGAAEQPTTARTATTLDGVFAAGEVTDQIYRQAITASAEGAMAAMDAERWLRNHPAPEPVIQDDVKSNAKQRLLVPLQTVLTTQHKEEEKTNTKRHNNNNNNNNNVPDVAEEEPNPPPPQHEMEEDDVDNCDLTQQDCITKTVNKYPVVVFEKPYCPYCRKALEALAAEGLPVGHANLHVVDLTLLGAKTRLVQDTLQRMTGRRTVPNVFLNGESIGGGDETSKFHREGRLHDMLVRAKAIIDNEPAGEGKEPCDDLTKEECITQLVNQYPVVVFSKANCPHCKRALEALALEGLSKHSPNLHVVDIKRMPNMSEIQDALERMTGFRTVPNVHVGGKSIGGGSDTVKFQKDGELREMLARANAI